MISELANDLLESSSIDDNERILEIRNLICGSISRKIIGKAANSYLPISSEDFKEVNKATMIRYLNLLENMGILKPVWDKNIKRFTITPSGSHIAKTLFCTRF
jgi:DNA-binding PadR family transcriptional regulator